MPVKRESLKRSKELNAVQGGKKIKKFSLSAPQLADKKQAGVVLTFGQGDVGQLGLGDAVIERMRPALVPALKKVVEVYAGGMHTVCLTSDGEVFTFGCNDDGGLGRDSSKEGSEFVPGKVELPGKAVQITAGDSHTAALLEDGRVFAWGSFRLRKIVDFHESVNDENFPAIPTEECSRNPRAGHRRTTSPTQPPPIPAYHVLGTVHSITTGHACASHTHEDSVGVMGLTLKGVEKSPVEMLPEVAVAKIASGSDHIVMLTTSGRLFTCGRGEQGQLGRVTERGANRKARQGLFQLLTPAVVTFRPRVNPIFDNVWAGSYCTFAIENSKRQVYTFGLNNYQQLGFRSDVSNISNCHFQPVVSKSLSGKSITKICTGEHHTIALDAEGKVYALGRKEYGRLGLGEDCTDAESPVLVPALSGKNCVDVACGSAVSLAVADDGTAYSWGMGTSGQLGTGDESDVHEPQLIKGKQLETLIVCQVSAGGQHSVLLALEKKT